MIVEVRLRPEAEADVADAALWYEARQPGLGHRFLDEIEGALSAVSETPEMFPVVHRNTRRAWMRRFPFGLYYRIEEAKVVVLAVMHARRSPRRWQRRE